MYLAIIYAAAIEHGYDPAAAFAVYLDMVADGETAAGAFEYVYGCIIEHDLF